MNDEHPAADALRWAGFGPEQQPVLEARPQRPVAWRFRLKSEPNLSWIVTDREPPTATRRYYEVEPLYTGMTERYEPVGQFISADGKAWAKVSKEHENDPDTVTLYRRNHD